MPARTARNASATRSSRFYAGASSPVLSAPLPAHNATRPCEHPLVYVAARARAGGAAGLAKGRGAARIE